MTFDYEKLEGDLAWEFTGYASNKIRTPRAETEVAISLAKSMRRPIIFSGDMNIPYLYYIATPTGNIGHAILAFPDEDDQRVVVSAVDLVVSTFPNAQIRKFSELARKRRAPTPISDQAFLEDSSHSAYDPMRMHLENWELLTISIAKNWSPSGWYPADFYLEDLETRDELAKLLPGQLEPIRERIESAIVELDNVYARLTLDDAGKSLTEALGTVRIAGKPWYWHRRPDPPPWIDS